MNSISTPCAGRRNEFSYTASTLAAAVGGRLVIGSKDVALTGFTTDSRHVCKGDAFFALRGERLDGHDFLGAASKAGARVAVVDNVRRDWSVPADSAVILVKDSTLALRDAASFHRSNLTISTLAVTGTCGKSTVKSMAGVLLGELGAVCVAQKSFNNRIGVSLTILSADPSDRFLVLELGANHPGEIDELAALARPNVATVTTIGEAHLEGFGSINGVRKAKGEVLSHIRQPGVLVVNSDNAHCEMLAKQFRGKVLRFGFNRDADFRPEKVEESTETTRFSFRGRTVTIPMPGRHNVLNALAAIASCEALAQDVTPVLGALACFSPPEQRAQTHRIGDMVFLQDDYNSNPTAMQAAVEMLASLGEGRRKILVCGDMLELGPGAGRLHRRIGRESALKGVDVLLAYGGFAAHVGSGFRAAADVRRTCFEFNQDEFTKMCQTLLGVLVPGSCILIKGSRGMRMERVMESIRASLCGAASRERPAA